MFENLKKKIEFTASNSMFDQKILESILDNCKPNPVVEKIMGYKAIERNLIESLSAYECKYGFTPNKIVMGCDVYQYFRRQFYYGYIEEEELNSNPCTFYGIPVEVDHKNPNKLEIGHMIRLS